MNKFQKFLAGSYTTKSYYATLQTFLKKQQRKGKSIHTIERMFYNLHPIGEKLNNPQLNQITRNQLRAYIDNSWLHLARDTMRTRIGDVRQFFKWCKKKRLHKQNIASKIKPVKQKFRRRRRRLKAAPERDLKQIMKHLAGQLKNNGLIYQGLFKELCIAEEKIWSKQEIMTLRDLFAVTFLYETGARAGELAELGSKAMNRATSQRSCAYTITVVGKEEDVEYYFTQRTAEFWHIWQQIRPNAYSMYAMISWKHKPKTIKSSGISQMIFRRCEQVEIKRPFRANAIRHAKIKRSRKMVGIKTTSILIDHESIDTTWNYANIDEDEIAQAAIKTGLRYNVWD